MTSSFSIICCVTRICGRYFPNTFVRHLFNSHISFFFVLFLTKSSKTSSFFSLCGALVDRGGDFFSFRSTFQNIQNPKNSGRFSGGGWSLRPILLLRNSRNPWLFSQITSINVPGRQNSCFSNMCSFPAFLFLLTAILPYRHIGNSRTRPFVILAKDRQGTAFGQNSGVFMTCLKETSGYLLHVCGVPPAIIIHSFIFFICSVDWVRLR